MRKRQGASLLNVLVFMMFAIMIMSQVFFFAKWSADSAAENREIMMYRFHLDSLIEEAKSALRETGGKAIVHNEQLDNTGGTLKFSEFYEGATARYSTSHKWELSTKTDWDAYKDSNDDNVYSLTIHDLDYSFDISGFNRETWTKKYGNTSADKKIFAAMLPIGSVDLNASGDIIRTSIGKPQYGIVYNRFYLIRATAKLPDSYYGRKLMYQVLVRRDEQDYRNLDVLSFQEVWF